MRKFTLICLFFVSATFGLKAQSFTVDNDSIYFTGNYQSSSFASPYISIYNVSGDTLTLRWVREQENIPGYWRSSICTEYYCYSIPDDSATWSILPSDSNLIYIHIYPYGNPDFGNVVLRLFDINQSTSVQLYYFADAPASVNENSSGSISIFPNPVAGTINVNLPAGETSVLRIRDLGGRIISEISSNGGVTAVDVTALSAGVYIFESESADGSVRKSRFVKE
jgi:hypothetical protein